MKYNKWITACIVCLSFALTSCTNTVDDNNTEDLTQTTQESTEEIITPVSGGTLSVAIRNPSTLNPLLNEDESIDEILKLVYDDLIILDEQQKPASNIVSSWELSQDGTTLTLKIRNDITWHNANQLTSKDIIFSMETIKKSQPTSAYKACINNILSFSAPDDYTVKIIYNQPFSGAVYALNFPIISSEYYKGENVLTSNRNMAPIGTGAYEFNGFTTMKELNLKKNSRWFKGVPYIDNIKAVVIPQKDAELYAFEQGQIDLLSTDVVDWKKYSGTKETKIHEYITNYYDFIGINFNNSFLNDKLVRQALAYAVPKDKIVEEIYLKHAVQTDTPINPYSWLNDSKELIYKYNANKSKELLKQAGWEDLDQNGILEKAGAEFKISLLVNEENTQRVQTASIIQTALKEIGIDLAIDVQKYDIYTQRLTQKSFDTFLGGWQLSTIPEFTFAFHSLQATNFISYNNPNMDTLLQQAFSAVGDTAMKESYKNIANHIIDELPYISLYFRNAAVLTNGRIKGDMLSDMNNVYLGLENCFIYEK